MSTSPPRASWASGVATVARNLLGELISPMQCASCEERVAPSRLFCGGCGVSVLLAGEQPAGQHALYEYGGSVAVAVVRLKYAGRLDLAGRFGDALAAAAQRSSLGPGLAEPDLVVPVPLHVRRLAERGFNQAALLAAPVASALGVAYAPLALERTRETPSQASLDRTSRAENVASAFACASRKRVEGRRVLLVDDVRTTGATLRSCAETLLEGGARSVRTLVLASRDRDRQP